MQLSSPARAAPNPTVGVVMVVAASLFFSVNGTVSKLVLRAGIEPQQLTALRAAGAFTGLLLLSLVLRPGPRRLRVTRAELPLLLGFGVIGFFLVPMLYFMTIARLPVGIGLLIQFTAPAFVALWARFGQRQRVRPRLWGGLVLSLAGLAGVAEIWRGGGGGLDGLGVLAGLAAAVTLAVYYVVGGRVIRQRDTLSVTTWGFGVSAVAGLLLRAVTAGTSGWEPLGGTEAGVPVTLLAAYVVVLGSIVPYLLIAGGLRHLPATSVGIVGMVEPVLASAVAWFVLDETLNAAQLAGGTLVLLGVALAETARVAPTVVPAPDVIAATCLDEERPRPAGDRAGPARDPAGPARDPAGPARDPAGPARDPAGPAGDPAGPARDWAEPAGDRREAVGERHRPAGAGDAERKSLSDPLTDRAR